MFLLVVMCFAFFFFFFKQKTAYEMRISDWSSDVCSSDLGPALGGKAGRLVDDDRRFVAVNDHRLDIGDFVFAQRWVLGLGCSQRRSDDFGRGYADRLPGLDPVAGGDRKSTRLNSSH